MKTTFGGISILPGQVLSNLAALQHLFGVLQGGVRHLRAAQHTGDFVAAFFVRKMPDAGSRATALSMLFDQIVLVGEGGDLREMSNAEHLLAAREGL